MKIAYIACSSIVYAAIWMAPNNSRADQAEDETAIRKNAENYVAAYNNQDAKALAAMWSPDAVYLDPSTGETAVGQEDIERFFAKTWADTKDVKLEVGVDSVRFVSPNVAIENGTARIIRPNEEPEESGYTAVNVKRDGKWLLDRVAEEVAAPPLPSNYKYLKDLEWMIGTWMDQDEKATVQIDCQWTKNHNFMHRSFAVVLLREGEAASSGALREHVRYSPTVGACRTSGRCHVSTGVPAIAASANGALI